MSSSAPAPGEEPILAELAAVGIKTRSLADLRRSGRRYRQAIPMLLNWLPKVDDHKVREEIVRALSVPSAKPVATVPMIEELRRVDASVDPTGTGLRWTVGNALEVLFDDSSFDQLVELARNRQYGKSRQMIVVGFGKSKRPEAVDARTETDDSTPAGTVAASA